MGSTDLPVPSQSLRVERKQFTFELKENPRGQFLRITEEVGGRRDAIIIPLSGVQQFRDALDEIIRASQKYLPKEE
ncbi:MAG: DNA-binding protein [Verrucomicrobia bacterium]|nr:DNA-binding protein [Verrucomicrobiota bacterium]